jgi:hypothetical protein
MIQSGHKKTAADWFFPSISDLVFLCLFFWVLRYGVHLLADGDTGWHIITGNNILSTFKVPYADPYSYTMPATPWTSHEWLAEVVFASIHRVAGMNGVVVLTASVVAFTSFLLYRYLLKRGVGTFTSVFMTVIAALASSLHWLARPHIFSMPLTIATFIVLDRYHREGRGRLWLLPAMMLLWVNLHGGYILGLIMAIMYAGGNLFSWVVSGKADKGSEKRAKAFSLVVVLMFLAAFVNPHGPAILYFPFHLVGRSYIMDNIQEWLSPNFHKDRIFEFMLVAYSAVLIMSKKKPGLIEGGLLLFLTHMSLYSARYIPLLALVATPMVAPRAGEVMDEFAGHLPESSVIKRVHRALCKKSAELAPFEGRFRTHLTVYASVLLCFFIASSGGVAFGRQLMDFRHDKKIFPVDAYEFAVKNGINGRMFNNDGWGGYIIYRGYPAYKVFFDGRSDMYGVPFLKEYVKVARAEKGFEGILDKYGVDWVIFNANTPLCQILEAGGDWRLVYADKTANILLKATPQNRDLIEKYKDARFVPADDEK